MGLISRTALLLGILTVDVRGRITLPGILEHPWYRRCVQYYVKNSRLSV